MVPLKEEKEKEVGEKEEGEKEAGEKEAGREEKEAEEGGRKKLEQVSYMYTCMFSVFTSSERFFLLIETLSHQLVGWAHHDITVQGNLTNAARYK